MALIQRRHCEQDVFKMAYFSPNCGGWTKWGYGGLCTSSGEPALIALAALKHLFLGGLVSSDRRSLCLWLWVPADGVPADWARGRWAQAGAPDLGAQSAHRQPRFCFRDGF